MDFGQGALISGGMQMLGNYQNFKYQQKLAEQQNQYNIDMWRMQADYNSPQQQMERYRAAGLNPNLIYGQGSSGNMSVAPQMVTPSAPDFSEGMGKLGEGLGRLFNIENIRILRAERKKAEADASSAETAAKTARDTYEGFTALGNKVVYDPTTGRFSFDTPFKKYVNNHELSGLGFYTAMNAIASNYNRNELIPIRQKLFGSQNRYLQPQILMSNYEQRYQPYSFWIGQGSKVLNALPLPKFSFGRKDYNYNHNFNY